MGAVTIGNRSEFRHPLRALAGKAPKERNGWSHSLHRALRAFGGNRSTCSVPVGPYQPRHVRLEVGTAKKPDTPSAGEPASSAEWLEPFPPSASWKAAYLIDLMISISGRNSATTKNPTKPPMPTISMGSRSLDIPSTATSTSVS